MDNHIGYPMNALFKKEIRKFFLFFIIMYGTMAHRLSSYVLEELSFIWCSGYFLIALRIEQTIKTCFILK